MGLGGRFWDWVYQVWGLRSGIGWVGFGDWVCQVGIEMWDWVGWFWGLGVSGLVIEMWDWVGWFLGLGVSALGIEIWDWVGWFWIGHVKFGDSGVGLGRLVFGSGYHIWDWDVGLRGMVWGLGVSGLGLRCGIGCLWD